MGDQSAASRFLELSEAISELRDRGLHQSVRWAAEQLVGLSDGASDAAAAQRMERACQVPDHPKFVLARSYFDVKEYERAAHVLSGLCSSAKTVFLRCYSLYLAGEKRKEEERIETAGPLGKAQTSNPHLHSIETELKTAESKGITDAFCTYLKALIAVDREHKAEARELLVASLTAFPCHWGGWQSLQALCEDTEVISQLSLPAHWARDFFLSSVCLELQHNAEALSRLQIINQLFPGSDWITSQAASAQYNLRNFDDAEQLFEDLIARDPHRVEGMDIYSNILYVKEQFAELSHLAHRLAATDKYRPESCCVIGNYYSLKGQHEKAVEYFRRALRLNRTYLSAWTLMGHEYVELKNAPAAIDAYRHAVDLNPRDYRAWYGLGQTYELMLMPYYALYYYRRATMLRPSDARMWCALGQCYESEQLDLHAAAIRCYRRAVANGDREGIALHKLAKIYHSLGDRATAAHYYQLNLERLDAEAAMGQDAVDALLFLAEYSKDLGALSQAEALCQRLLDVGGAANTRAKALMREIRSRAQSSPSGYGIQQQQQQQQGNDGSGGSNLFGMVSPTPYDTSSGGLNFVMEAHELDDVDDNDDDDDDDDDSDDDMLEGDDENDAAGEGGTPPVDGMLVAVIMQQTSAPYDAAAAALVRHHGDVVGAVTELHGAGYTRE